MFTALAIVCALGGNGPCFSVTNQTVFASREECEKDAYVALLYAESRNFTLKRFACFEWGVEA